MSTGLFLLLLVFLPLVIYMRYAKRQSFESELRLAVEASGGTVLAVRSLIFGNGPWWVRGKGQMVLKVIYRDAAGDLRQLWGRTGVFGNDINWEYSDGEYDY